MAVNVESLAVTVVEDSGLRRAAKLSDEKKPRPTRLPSFWRVGDLQLTPIPCLRPVIFPKLEEDRVGDVYNIAKREAVRLDESSNINKGGR